MLMHSHEGSRDPSNQPPESETWPTICTIVICGAVAVFGFFVLGPILFEHWWETIHYPYYPH